MSRLVCAACLLLPMAASAEDCPEPVDTGALVTVLETAELAYGDLDVPAFAAATDKAAGLLPCINEKVPRNVAAQYHRIRGLQSFIERDPAGSTQAFAAARSIEPGYKFPQAIVPEGNPVLSDYTAIDPSTGKIKNLPPPMAGYLVIDGRTGTDRPLSFPTLFQIVDSNGVVVQTAYLEAGDMTPEYEPAPEGAAPPGGGGANGGEGAAPLPGASTGPNMTLLAGAGGAAVLSGALYGYAGIKAQDYRKNEHTENELNSLRGQVNTMVIISGATAALAVGLGAGSFLVSADGTLHPGLRVRF